MMDGGTTASPSYYYEGKEEVTLKRQQNPEKTLRDGILRRRLRQVPK